MDRVRDWRTGRGTAVAGGYVYYTMRSRLDVEHIHRTELGINFAHIRAKSLTVLNPLQRVDDHIMDDADLAGPLLFIICFGTFLLFVST